MSTHPAPKVSVCVVTYNQEKYIGQCLQSLVDQVTDFPFEVVVSDDCSTDETSRIVMDYAARYPRIVRPIIHGKNIGAYKNFIFVHRSVRGEYVAHVDGDDYVLPGKLAIQTHTLDSFKNVALSAHAVIVDGGSGVIGGDHCLPVSGGMLTLLRKGPYFVNSSIMYRAKNAFNYDLNEEIVDYRMHLEHASKGDVHLNKRPLGVYRWHDAGISKRAEHRDRIERLYEEAFVRALELGAPSDEVKIGILRRRKSLAIARLAAGDVPGFRQLINVSPEDRLYASRKHRILSALRYLPLDPVGVYFIRRMIA